MRARPASSHNSDPSRPTKMRSSTGCINQARNAVLAAASPISRPARAMRLACGRMNSRAKRRTSVTECACSARIARYLRMNSSPAVLEASALLGKVAGVHRRHHAYPHPDPHQTYEEQDTGGLSDIEDDGLAVRLCPISADRSLRSSHDSRSVLGAASEHIQQHGKTIAQSGLRRKAKLFCRAPRVPDRDPHFPAARRSTMHHELGATQLRHRLSETTNGRRFAGADIEYRSLGGRHPHRL